MPARHCELNGPNRVSLSPLSVGRRYGEGAERAHQMLRLALAGLPRIPAETNTDPLAVPCGSIRVAPGDPPERQNQRRRPQ